MKNKILIIGQAPPRVPQKYPYDTTQLYDWFKAVGINRDQALEMFEFCAMSDKFPGISATGGDKPPDTATMKAHYNAVLKDKLAQCDKIILLGNCPKQFFAAYGGLTGKQVLELIHPSKRNLHLFNLNKEVILERLKSFIH